MKVKYANPELLIRDPVTKRHLPAEGGDVPETSFWVRRVLSGELIRIDQPTTGEPTGREPVTPLTTR